MNATTPDGKLPLNPLYGPKDQNGGCLGRYLPTKKPSSYSYSLIGGFIRETDNGTLVRSEWACPSATDPTSTTKGGTFSIGQGYNFADGTFGTSLGNKRNPANISVVKSASALAVLGEVTVGATQWNNCYENNRNSLAYRHSDRCNFLFVDWHVESLTESATPSSTVSGSNYKMFYYPKQE